MMRVKLVIIRMSDGKTVKRLIRTRICRLSESGRPSPETSASALVSAPELSGAAACAKAGPAWKTARPTAMANPAQMIWRDLRFIVAFRDLVDAHAEGNGDRKSTRLKLQSLMRSSYAVFCLKKKKENNNQPKIYDTLTQTKNTAETYNKKAE